MSIDFENAYMLSYGLEKFLKKIIILAPFNDTIKRA
jgi:hypothetical protein